MEWSKATLDQLCEFKNGLWKGKKEPFIHVGVIRNTNFTKNGLLDDSDIAYLDVEEKQYKTRKLEFGDLILEKSGGGPKQPVGRVIPFEQADGEFSFSNFTSIIRIRDKTLLEYSYLHKFLHYLYVTGATEPMQRQSTGIRNLQLKEYKLVEVPLPPIPEQKRIVAILDQAFADIEQARAKTEQNLKNARELFESYLQQVFSQRGEGWVAYRLSDLCEITSKLIDPKEEQYLDLPHVGAGNMVSSTGELIEVKTAREEGLISGKFMFDESMVLYSKIRPYLMKVCKPDFIGLCSADVYPLSPIEGVLDKDYLFYVLLGKDFTDYAISGSGRAGMPKVNRTHLFNYTVSVPAIEKQREYVATINQIAAQTQVLEKLYSEKLIKLSELKKSILQKAFSGELTKTIEGDTSKGAAA